MEYVESEDIDIRESIHEMMKQKMSCILRYLQEDLHRKLLVR